VILLISTSLVTEITAVSHSAWPWWTLNLTYFQAVKGRKSQTLSICSALVEWSNHTISLICEQWQATTLTGICSFSVHRVNTTEKSLGLGSGIIHPYFPFTLKHQTKFLFLSTFLRMCFKCLVV
jgi:hypothetical protein